MALQFNFGASAFAVPGAVADHFLRLADETQLKVLLCLLRFCGSEPSAQAAAEYLHIEEERAQEAIDFWVQANVLSEGGLPGAGSAFAFAAPAPETAVKQPAPPVTAPAVRVQRSSKEIKLDPAEIAHELEGSQTLHDLFENAERLLARPLNHMEQRSLLWMHQYLSIPSEVILLLLAYCVSIGKYSVAYAEAIALSWHDNDILTLEQADEEIKRMTKQHTFTSEIRRMFEMRRSPTSKQQAYIDQWEAAGYSMALIRYAYETCVEATEKVNFKYIDKILTSCAAQGAATPEEAQALQKKYAQSKKNPSEQPEDVDKYLQFVNQFEEDGQ